MCSCLREVERWADFTPRSNCFSFLGMFGAQTKKREAENEVVRVENPVSELESPQRSTSKHEPK